MLITNPQLLCNLSIPKYDYLNRSFHIFLLCTSIFVSKLSYPFRLHVLFSDFSIFFIGNVYH